MTSEKLMELTESIVKAGYRCDRKDLEQLLEADLDFLCSQANRIREYFCGNQANLCTIINGKSGACSEDCKFCAQSSYHRTETVAYRFMPEERILEDCRENERQGVHRYSIVTSGRSLKGKELDQAVQAYRKLRRHCRIDLCASHGLLDEAALLRLKESGVTRYHENIETSRRNFPNICTTHTYQEKLDTLQMARKVGLEVCSGGIIGMGESWEDRIDMALDLAEIDPVSIPINVLQPIPGTAYEDQPPLTEAEILRTIALFRFANPTKEIRLAGGRMQMEASGRGAFVSGANATITGNMLTTSGSSIQEDIEMLSELGFTTAQQEADHE